MGDNAVGDDFGGDDLGPGKDGENGFDDVQADHHTAGTEGDRHMAFDPHRAPNERALTTVMTDADAGMECWTTLISHFSRTGLDQNTEVTEDRTKMFVFTSHHRYQIFDSTAICLADTTEAAAASSKPKREKKEAFKIDFSSPVKDLKETAKELFAPVTRGAGIITFPNIPRERGVQEHTLPDDMHFSSWQLITLSVKPESYVSLPLQALSIANSSMPTVKYAWPKGLFE